MVLLASATHYNIPPSQYARVLSRREFKAQKYQGARYKNHPWNYKGRHLHAVTRPRNTTGRFSKGGNKSSTTSAPDSATTADISCK